MNWGFLLHLHIAALETFLLLAEGGLQDSVLNCVTLSQISYVDRVDLEPLTVVSTISFSAISGTFVSRELPCHTRV